MANMMGNAGGAGGPGAGPAPSTAAGADPQGIQASLGEGADAFAKQLEESGIPPGDFLKQLLADVMAEEGGSGGGGSNNDAVAAAAAAAAGANAGSSAKPTPPAPSTSAGGSGEQPAESFNDAIQRTIERMKESGDRATEAASTDDGLSDDMLAQLLKAVEAGAAGAGDDGDLTKMFMGMMEQLSNKDMLYEPMKELDGKFGPWIEQNKTDSSKVSAEDMQRFETQARIVKQIVQKFEEEGYSDENPKCREYVWERMQEVWIFPTHLFIQYANFFSRCKPLAARRKSSSPIHSWRTWAKRLMEPGACPTARSNRQELVHATYTLIGLLCTVHIHVDTPYLLRYPSSKTPPDARSLYKQILNCRP